MDVAQIRQVYAQLDPPLWLVTAADGDRRGGLIATTVTQASIVAEMPRQIITIDKRHNTHALIEGSGAFALHLIDETQLDLVWRFGLQSGRDVDKLAGLPFRTGATGSPLLTDALAWFDCRVEDGVWTRATAPSTWLPSSTVAGNGPIQHSPIAASSKIAPPDQQKIMSEQYEHDVRLDAASIQRWRDEK